MRGERYVVVDIVQVDDDGVGATAAWVVVLVLVVLPLVNMPKPPTEF